MTAESQRALAHLAEQWRRERMAARAQAAAEREQRDLAERVARGLALRRLRVEETDALPGERTLLWLQPQLTDDMDALRLGPGDPVRLWRDGHAQLGTLARRQGRRLGVAVDGNYAAFVDEGELNLDREAPEVTFDRGDEAIQRLQRAAPGSPEAHLRELLYGDGVPRFGTLDDAPTLSDAGLNGPQRAAVRQALCAHDVALIHGPPGTGKTRVLVEVVRLSVAWGERVLVTAPSNTAVDNLTERLIQTGLPIVRLGHPARVAPSVEGRSLDALVDRSEDKKLARRWIARANELRRRAHARYARGSLDRREQRQLLAEARQLMRDARRALDRAREAALARCPVVCATAAGADSHLLRDQRFDRVVLDEATQAPDPLALAALWRAPRAVLAGDPCQLPPTVLDPQAATDGLATSAFERLARRHGPGLVSTLRVQYRMHEALMRFPSEQMYDGALLADASVAQHALAQLPGVAPDSERPAPLCFIDTAGKGWEERREGDDPSARNPGQARCAVAEAQRLLDRGLPPDQLAIITPYDGQARLLREATREARARGLEVGTVDGFQGREKEAVIVDLVRSNDAQQLGFLRDTRRMNVALTRARRQLIVVGDSATLGQHPYYAAFLRAVEAQGAYLSAWTLGLD